MLKTTAFIWPIDEKPATGSFTQIPNIWLYGRIARGLKSNRIVEENGGDSLIQYMREIRPLELYDVHVTVKRKNGEVIDAMAFLWRGERDADVRAIITESDDRSAIEFAHKKQEEYARSI